MSDRTTKLTLTTGSRIDIEGCGSDIKLMLTAHRMNKRKVYERYELEINVGRWSIRQLARQIATMHARDRERIQKELARIEDEVSSIKQPETRP